MTFLQVSFTQVHKLLLFFYERASLLHLLHFLCFQIRDGA